MLKAGVLGVFALCLVCSIYADAVNDARFEQWRRMHSREYSSLEEYSLRSKIFQSNLLKIELHNAKKLSWTMKMNEYGDLTWDEFRRTKLGGTRQARKSLNPVNLFGKVTLPESVDWNKAGMITPVKNQGQCGSCWAFSTTGSVECAHAIATGDLKSLSEQELVDCSSSYGNNGCDGGIMDNAFQFIIDNNGLCTEGDYPYEAYTDVCRMSSCSAVPNLIQSYVDVAEFDQDALKAAVAQQAVSVAIEADQDQFQFYSGGVMNFDCGTSLDHGVLVVGYGRESGMDYWLVKNSWGTDWGEAGYFKLKRGNGSGPGMCGVAVMPSYPVVNTDGFHVRSF